MNGNVYQSILNENHLLIVGATGTGKSVLINALVYNILLKPAKDNQIILIDPKRVELVQYKDCPHTYLYASEPKSIIEALKKVVSIMDSRYDLMQKQGLKKTDKFNIYVIIDEYADCIDICGKNVENNIIRIAQLGRAAGIHIIMATQHCTTKVINTRIKSNFSSRILLKTAFKYESQHVIGMGGAELLPQYGQGYFLSGVGCSLIYIDMIPDNEIEDLINKLKKEDNPYIKKINGIRINEDLYNDFINEYVKIVGKFNIPALCKAYNLTEEAAKIYINMAIEAKRIEPKDDKTYIIIKTPEELIREAAEKEAERQDLEEEQRISEEINKKREKELERKKQLIKKRIQELFEEINQIETELERLSDEYDEEIITHSMYKKRWHEELEQYIEELAELINIKNNNLSIMNNKDIEIISDFIDEKFLMSNDGE